MTRVKPVQVRPSSIEVAICWVWRHDRDMEAEIDLIVFTDLDGTLIDHDTYQWAAAGQALDVLRKLSAGVVLSSSKTAAEVSSLRGALELAAWPAIVENGAGLLAPYLLDVEGGSKYQDLLAAIASLPQQLRCLFHGFGQATAAQVAAMTGLTVDAAKLAKRRSFSEPGQWQGTDAQKACFITELASLGVQAQQGGRFLTLSFGGNKADQMRAIINTYHPKHTIALGDAPNDVQMLEAAEFGVVVANPHRPPLPPLKGEGDGHILRTKAAGPVGWNAAMLDLLNRLKLH